MDWKDYNPFGDENDRDDREEKSPEELFREKYPEIEPENRMKNSWLMFLPFIIVFTVQFALLFMAFEFLFTWKVANFTADSYEAFVMDIMNTIGGTTFNLIVSILYALVCGVLFTIWYRKKFYLKKREREIAQGRTPVWKKNPLLLVIGIVALCVGGQYVCTYLLNGLAILFPSWLLLYQQLMEGIGLGTGNVTVLLVLYSVILGPIVEELTFRGLTMGYGRKSMPFWMANLMQAFLFAALHMNPLQSIYTFIFGLLLGYAVYRSDSLGVGIALHIGFNLIGTLAPQIVVMGTNPIAFFLFLLLGMVLVYAGLECIGRCGPTKEERAAAAAEK